MFFDHAVLDAITRGAVLSSVGLVWVIALVRLIGLRSFSKMTNFDFVMTVAMGSLLAGAAQTSNWLDLLQIATAMVALFATQYGIATLRRRYDVIDAALQNNPIMLMRDGVIDRTALAATRVTEGDLIAKLREANVLDLSSVRAVVLETTGDVSVLHGSKLDDVLIKGISRAD